MATQPENTSLFYIGATIVNPYLLNWINEIRERIALALNVEKPSLIKSKECHITLVPPFYTTYEEATALNTSFAVAQLLRSDPVHRIEFLLGRLMTLTFQTQASICFKIHIPDEDAKVELQKYVKMLRRKVVSTDQFAWREQIPSVWNPHITVVSGQDTGTEQRILLWNPKLRKIVTETKQDLRKLTFLTGYLTIYAKYGYRGWQPLSSNPRQK